MNECEIFMGALEFDAPEERSTFLDESCRGDEQLRSRVERLLECHSESGSLLEHPAANLAATRDCGETDAVDKSAGEPPVLDFSDMPLDFLERTKEPGSLGRLGQFEILEPVGRGGMGIVLKAWDTKLHRVVAVKVVSPELASNVTARKRFLREGQAAAAISHDHVVRIYAVEENEREGQKGLPYLVMEFIDGPSLQEKIDQEGPLELQEILRIGRQMASGLAAAHEQGLIHRDVKPSNILLPNGVERVQITDFGLARAVDDVGMTRTGEITGTPQYMSPEQALGLKVDPLSDLFSLGSVLYAMCTGRGPFRADSTVAALRRVCDDTPRPIREINPDIPVWLVDVIDGLLEKKPEDRFQSAEEVSQVLSKCLVRLQEVGPSSMTGIVVPHKKKRANTSSSRSSSRLQKWLVPAWILLSLGGLLGVTEATGVTQISSTVIKVMTGEGTLIIEVDDPTIQVSLDGEELSISGGGIRELKLSPGQYKLKATKDGKAVEQKLVSISRGDRELVRITREASHPPENENPSNNTQTAYKSVPSDSFTLLKTLDRSGRTFGKNHWVKDLAFLPEGRQLICGSQYAELWDVTTENVRLLMAEKTNIGCIAVAFSPPNKLIATGHFRDGVIRLWDAETGNQVGQLEGQTPKVVTLDFSSDGQFLLSGSAEPCGIRLWDVTKRTKIWQTQFEGYHYAGTISPDGQMAIISTNLSIRPLDLQTGEPAREPLKAVAHVLCLDISPNGKNLVSGGRDGTIQVWDLSSGEEIRRFVGHKSAPRDVRFLSDGQHILSGAEDRSLRLWNLKTGKLVAKLSANRSILTSLAVSPDGKTIATGGGHIYDPVSGESKEGDDAIRLWRLPDSVWPKEDQTE